MLGNVRYIRRDRKWQAYIDYRDENGKRHYLTRHFSNEEAARIGLRIMLEENAELLKRAKKVLLTTSSKKVSVSYVCPSCSGECHVRNKRLIRFEGATVGICKSCYRSGPVAVGDNLRKHQEGSP